MTVIVQATDDGDEAGTSEVEDNEHYDIL